MSYFEIYPVPFGASPISQAKPIKPSRSNESLEILASFAMITLLSVAAFVTNPTSIKNEQAASTQNDYKTTTNEVYEVGKNYLLP